MVGADGARVPLSSFARWERSLEEDRVNHQGQFPSVTISFNLLHKDCGSRLKQQYTCIKEGVTVERDQMVKGYEFAKDQYVQFSPEEIKALEEVGSKHCDR